jgi:hypothetical protein
MCQQSDFPLIHLKLQIALQHALPTTVFELIVGVFLLLLAILGITSILMHNCDIFWWKNKGQ